MNTHDGEPDSAPFFPKDLGVTRTQRISVGIGLALLVFASLPSGVLFTIPLQ